MGITVLIHETAFQCFAYRLKINHRSDATHTTSAEQLDRRASRGSPSAGRHQVSKIPVHQYKTCISIEIVPSALYFSIFTVTFTVTGIITAALRHIPPYMTYKHEGYSAIHSPNPFQDRSDPGFCAVIQSQLFLSTVSVLILVKPCSLSKVTSSCFPYTLIPGIIFVHLSSAASLSSLQIIKVPPGFKTLKT